MANRTKYSKEICKKLEKEFANGATVEDACNNVGISIQVLYNWKNSGKIELIEAIKRGRERAINKVEHALFKNAMGFEYTEETAGKEKGKDGSEKVVIKKVKKFAYPNTTAQIFFLKNRNPAEWKDRQDISHSGNIGVQIIDDIPDGEETI